MIKPYLNHLDTLGLYSDVTIGQETNRAILIKINNADELARSQGKVATLFQSLAPSSIEAKVYEETAKQLAAGLRSQNVKADVTVVEPKNFVPADGKHIWADVGLAIGGAGIVAILWFLFSGRR